MRTVCRVLRPPRLILFRTAALARYIPRTMSSSAPSQKPKILGVETWPTPARWLKLEKITWQDEEGKERLWEVANRSTRSKTGVDIHDPNGGGPSVVLIEQYRPPVAATVVELPAGLIDEGEDAASTALRELHEETGYTGEGVTVRSVSPVVVKDPGMTGANMNLVVIDIRRPPNAPPPQPKLEPGEHIIQRLVPLKDLETVMNDYYKKGFAIDALIWSVITGMKLAGSM